MIPWQHVPGEVGHHDLSLAVDVILYLLPAEGSDFAVWLIVSLHTSLCW